MVFAWWINKSIHLPGSSAVFIYMDNIRTYRPATSQNMQGVGAGDYYLEIVDSKNTARQPKLFLFPSQVSFIWWSTLRRVTLAHIASTCAGGKTGFNRHYFGSRCLFCRVPMARWFDFKDQDRYSRRYLQSRLYWFQMVASTIQPLNSQNLIRSKLSFSVSEPGVPTKLTCNRYDSTEAVGRYRF